MMQKGSVMSSCKARKAQEPGDERSWEEVSQDRPLEPLAERPQCCWHLDFGRLASRTMRESIPCSASPARHVAALGNAQSRFQAAQRPASWCSHPCVMPSSLLRPRPRKPVPSWYSRHDEMPFLQLGYQRLSSILLTLSCSLTFSLW